MRNLLIVIFAGALLGGCAMSPKVIEYDPEKDNIAGQHIPEAQPTPDHVVVVNKDGILIDVQKMNSMYDEQVQAELQQWAVFAMNDSNADKCVGVVWRLMDFRFITNYTTDFLLKAQEMKFLGKMQQTTMTIDGVKVAPPPSGYVHAMRVIEPREDAIEGEECMFIVDEKDIIEDKGVIER